MNDEFDRMLSKLVINIALPGMILARCSRPPSCPRKRKYGCAWGFPWRATSSCLLWPTPSRCFAHSRRASGRVPVHALLRQRRIHRYPVLSAIFGPDALVYAAVFNLPFNFFVFTVGAWFLTQDTDGDVKVQTTWRTFVTPVMLSRGGGASHARAASTTRRFWGCAEHARLHHHAGGAAHHRLVAGEPAGTRPHRRPASLDLLGVPSARDAGHHLGRLHAFVPAGLMFSVAVVLAGMPVATNGTMLCYQYGGNSRVMAQGTFVTTVLAIASIPILAAFVGAVI